MSKGFHLYTQIWNDNPPLFSQLLTFWFKLFGPSVYYARILVLLFSCLLLWAFYQTIRMSWGDLPAAIGTVLLALSNAYPRLSVSVTIGLPALALAMLSIYFLSLYNKSGKRIYLFLSAVIMALSLQTKFSPALLVPIMILEILLTPKDRTQPTRSFYPALIWTGIFLLFYFIVTLFYFGLNFNLFIRQILGLHLNKLVLSFSSPSKILDMLSRDYDVFLLALLGAIIGLSHKDWRIRIPLIWLLLAVLILANHKPIWDYYYLLISIPLCWLAAIALQGLFLRRRVMRLIIAAFLALAVCRLPLKFNYAALSLWGETTPQERQIINLLSKDNNRWIVTDLTLFAFYAKALVVPEMAFFSQKMMQQLRINQPRNYALTILDRYKPEKILMGDWLRKFFLYNPDICSYIEQNYSLVYQEYLRKEIKWDPYIVLCGWSLKPILQIIPDNVVRILRRSPWLSACLLRIKIPVKSFFNKNNRDQFVQLFQRNNNSSNE
jgi:4-amino-4-deoxy-L-arabinose transferase-like glycosyltransferase